MVTTHGDIEGKSTRYLGIFTGYIDEIALSLKDKTMYNLTFIEPKITIITPDDVTSTSNDVNLDIFNDDITKIKGIFKDRPVSVVKSNQYKCITIKSLNKNDIERNNAIKKLKKTFK